MSVCQMSISLVSLLLLSSLSYCACAVCDEGPPGRYCLPDLSGWHECAVDPHSHVMIDKLHRCEGNTRCQCFDGPSCPDKVNDPCAPFVPAPVFPQTFTMVTNVSVQECTPVGCIMRLYSERRLQDMPNGRMRNDTGTDDSRQSFFLLPLNEAEWFQFQVLWNQIKCSKELINKFPRASVPPYFSYDGKVKLRGQVCERWLWKTGGHNAGMSRSVHYYYVRKDDVEKAAYRPVRFEDFEFSAPPVKRDVSRIIDVVEFVSGTVDKTQFLPPRYCWKRD